MRLYTYTVVVVKIIIVWILYNLQIIILLCLRE